MMILAWTRLIAAEIARKSKNLEDLTVKNRESSLGLTAQREGKDAPVPI